MPKRGESKTMLKTNSKKARENVRKYILTDADYIAERIGCDPDTLTEAEALRSVWEIFKDEYYNPIHPTRRNRLNVFDLFAEWASGLALGGLFLYYYNVSAVQVLGDILEETEEERSKYSEEQAENLLTLLIYREVSKA